MAHFLLSVTGINLDFDFLLRVHPRARPISPPSLTDMVKVFCSCAGTQWDFHYESITSLSVGADGFHLKYWPCLSSLIY